jgi:chitinase
MQNNKMAPKQFLDIGYFEAWNNNRKCLTMNVADIPRNKYTRIHFAFADITLDYQVSVNRFTDQWEMFRKAKGYKRILAFGGWDFSTSASTASIFRDGVRPGNRERLASNLVNFILNNDLDGIDFDWEYPSVPDMDWLPRSSPDEGPDYVAFLRLVRSKLPQKSISIAAPASFWYLKGIPIEEIATIVDYVVYMTYDL